jgi:uncharacterized protein YndB with AHSA1/START domain
MNDPGLGDTVLLDMPVLLAAVDCAGRDDGWTLTFVRQLAGTPDEVWAMLTDPARLSGWAPFRPDRDLSRVGPVTMALRGPAGTEMRAAEVTRADRAEVLEYAGPDDRIRWSLRPGACRTRVTLQHTFAEPDWAPEAAADWHLCLDAVQRLLVGDCADADRWQLLDGSRRRRLYDLYRLHLGLPPEPDRR